MADLLVTASDAAPVAAGLITIAGVATGLPNDLVFPSFAGALWALRRAEEDNLFWRIVQLLVGTLSAVWITPPALLIAGQIIPLLDHIPQEVLRYPLAMTVGWMGITGVLRWFGDRTGVSK